MKQELKAKTMPVYWFHLTHFGHTLEYRWNAFGVLLNAFGCLWMTLDDF